MKQVRAVLDRLRVRSWIAFSLVFGVSVVSSALGEKPSTSVNASSRKSNDISFTAAAHQVGSTKTEFELMEEVAMGFVTTHHPELVSLLQLLKAMKEKEYESAIRDIIRVQKRLESLVKREPVLHAIELETWQLQSKIDLLLAQGYAKDKAFNKKSLKQLLKEQVEVQKKRWKHEEASLAKRQEQVAELLRKLEGHEDERVEQQFATLMKRVDTQSGKSSKPKPEAKPTKETKGKP